jgi:RimJ/RimL family protein N-acetyltransferase
MAIPELTTDRLLLRPFVPEDAATVRDLVSAREVAATIDGMPHPYPDGAAETWIASHAADAKAGTDHTWAITLRHDATLIGAMTLHVMVWHQRGQIGYWTGRPYWNRGFTTEAAERVVAHAFQALSLHRIQAFCLPSNTGSVRVLEKLAFRREGVLRDYVLKWEQFQDRAIYGLLRDEWDA